MNQHRRSVKYPSNLLFQTARKIQLFFEEQNWHFAFIGGLALLRWGQIRLTEDVDVTLITQFQNDEYYVDTILEQFCSRIDNGREFALQNRVLLLKSSNGVGIDISLGGLPFEQQLVVRSSLYEYEPQCLLRTCSAEDLIVCKAFAARDRDWADVGTILQRQKGKLDNTYILDNLRYLCEFKESPEIVTKIEEMIRTTK
jgi:hypothetical protein